MNDRCYHCNEPIPDQLVATVEFDGVQRYTCCFGCQAVMQAIVDAGLGDYYRFRTTPASSEEVALSVDAMSIYDEPEFTARLVSTRNDSGIETAEVTLSVDGIGCGACVWLLERSLRSVSGVISVSVNGSTHRARLSFDSDSVTLSDLLRQVQRVGYHALPLDVAQREQYLQVESRQQIQRIFIAGIAMMQVMMYALPGYLNGSEAIAQAHLQLLNWASMVLTTPVMLFSAAPFLKGAWRGVKCGSVGMDLPVSIGIVSAFCVSVYRTLEQQGETYFDSVSMFVFLLLVARYLEWSVRCRSLRSIDDICHRSVESAQQLINGEFVEVPAARLKPGDTIRVASGGVVPVNTRLIRGHSLMDLSVLTGESLPVAVSGGDDLPGGAQVAGAPVQLEVTATQSDSTLSTIATLVERGAAEKPLLITTADRVAHYFVWCLMVFAAVVFAVWWSIDTGRAATIAVTVLVISCPCALSLATPAALAASTSRLINSRLLITRSHVLQSAATLTDVVFDKTGTLTHGTPRVIAVDVAEPALRSDALALAAALETGAAHPFASAIQNLDTTNSAQSIVLQATDHVAGSGVSASLGPTRFVRIGSAQWCHITERQLKRFNRRYSPPITVASQIYLCESRDSEFSDPLIIARFCLADTLRDEAASIVSIMKTRGLRVHLCSGDESAVVMECADRLGIDHWKAAAGPQEKQSYVRSLQSQGANVMMVGDGINDAPVLATADVSVAIGKATSLAQTSADVIALTGELSVLSLLLRQAERTAAVIKQNLCWALAYNSTAIPAAALGLVTPWMAAIGMAASSLLVAGNSARLWREHKLKSTDTPKPSREVQWNH